MTEMKGHKAHHHRKHHNSGGAAHKPDHDVYAGEHSNVVKEAEEKKKGGRAEHHLEGHKPKKHRLDRPGRKRGGRAGADKMPLTGASHVTAAHGHKSDTGMAESPTKVQGD